MGYQLRVYGDCSSVLAITGLKVYSISTMKFLVVLALFSAAAAEPEAEADPWYYYTHGAAAYHPYTYGYGYPYYQYAVPAVKAAEEKVEEVVEAKEVKKPVVYTRPYYYGGYAGLHYPYAYNYAPVAHTVVKPYTYYANSGGAVHVVKKREAEAEAEADPNAWYGYGYGYRPYYGYGYQQHETKNINDVTKLKNKYVPILNYVSIKVF